MEKWWKKAFGYQIYLRSFKDSNDDGIGDIRGIIEKIDYLAYLGINLLWICPFYDSPMDDNGYDVRDYLKISQEYGKIDDLEELVEIAHKKGIKIMMDLVLNHTSDEHFWFQEAKKDKNSPYHDYYIWQPPRYKNGVRFEPTNWASFFGGSCWEYNEITDEYYMKIFSRKMPDLNWKNPKVHDEIVKIAKYWIQKGIDGFRVDAVAHLGKDDFIDSTMEDISIYKPEWKKYSNLPVVHDYLHELNEKVFSKYDIVTVGEVGGCATIEDAIKYTSIKTKELNMVFNFDHNWCNNGWNRKDDEELKINVPHMKEIFNKWQTKMYGKGWNAIYWLNHDQPRVATHYGSLEYPLESCKMLATIMYFMSGTPFIYNGEEIGMTNPIFKSIDDFNDVSIKNQYKINVLKYNQDENEFIRMVSYSTRDNARTIMQWNDDENAGFSKHKPWNLLNQNYHKINVDKEIKDENSLLNYYKKIINIRLHSDISDCICYGDYQQYLINDKHLYIYTRTYKNKKILVVANLTKDKVILSSLCFKIIHMILSNYEKQFSFEFEPFEARVMEIEKLEEV